MSARSVVLLAVALSWLSVFAPGRVRAEESYNTSGLDAAPYTWQVQRELRHLRSSHPLRRAEALENLAFLRAFDAADAAVPMPADPHPEVRREAVIFLGFCGARTHLAPLLEALDDPDWSVRQGAHAALSNLIGANLPFDALAAPGTRRRQVQAWRRWVEDVPEGAVPEQLAEMLDPAILNEPEGLHRVERAARALAVFGTSPDAGLIMPLLQPYLDGREVQGYAERLLVEACIRTLGRLGGDRSTEVLKDLLAHTQLAVYAADALGDVGGPDVALALIDTFQEYAITPKGRMNWKRHSRYTGIVQRYHKDDAPRFSAWDRVPRTAYAICHALVRSRALEDRAVLEGIRRISPHLLATLPSAYDSTIFYRAEPYGMMVAYLLERAGMRQAVVDTVLAGCGADRAVPEDLPQREPITALANYRRQAAWAVFMLPALCTQQQDVPALLAVLEDGGNYTRIAACKALINLDAREAADDIAERLAALPDDVEHGYNTRARREEFNVHSGRFKEAYIRALGKLGRPEDHTERLARLCLSDRNNLDIRHAACRALVDLGGEQAREVLRKVERDHEFHSVQMVAREYLRRHGIAPLPRRPTPPGPRLAQASGVPETPEDIDALVFLKGPHDTGNLADAWDNMQAYVITDDGPTYRWARNIYKLSPVGPDGKVTPVTNFETGYVADLEVSLDGRKLLFARRTADMRTEDDDAAPWWHIYEINADGTGLRQITGGPYHDVQPAYLGDGRIVFSSTRLGTRDEYHGYLCTGLAVCNPDGTDIHCIGFNLGRDAEPAVDEHGRILFSRLELFYSRMKTEWNLLRTSTDGSATMTLYGPERRDWWRRNIRGGSGLNEPRHRVLRVTQPQPFLGERYLINSYAGPMIVGPGRYEERILQQDNSRAITTPWPINASTLLVAAGERPWARDREGNLKLRKDGSKTRDIKAAADLGLHWMDTATGELALIYNDPETSEFEPRPLAPRRVPAVMPENPLTRSGRATATIYCQSVFNTQHSEVRERGRYVRIVEGLPSVQRHQTGRGGRRTKNHGGATGRVLGTVPLAADGSFHLEVPSDRFFQIQVLDSNRHVVGNELIWQYARPGETKGCFGCHEGPNTAPRRLEQFPQATQKPPLPALPRGDDMVYRAKMWYKGGAPWPREERMRTVNAVSLLGRL